MIEKVKIQVKELMKKEEIKGFLGLRNAHGHIGPYLFCHPEELEDLVIGDNHIAGDSRYPLNKYLMKLFNYYPNEKIGILVRGCDERGIKILIDFNQLKPENIVPVGITCPKDLAESCECLKPWPDEHVEGEEIKSSKSVSSKITEIDEMNLEDRFSHWMDEFTKCVKCYGCRDICPMCFCRECSLGFNDLIKTGELPPEMPIFHLTRAVHMADRCIDCGLCNETCPSDIPLRTLYKKVSDIMEKEFNYRPGFKDMKSPLNLWGNDE